jgi:hypothetical protein
MFEEGKYYKRIHQESLQHGGEIFLQGESYLCIKARFPKHPVLFINNREVDLGAYNTPEDYWKLDTTKELETNIQETFKFY